ncbi:MAG TPA: hypothetical protein VEQ09_08760 [Aquabacterium sp.]|nr:hypothetical protein [Aquabacterium sp.]
MTSDEASGQSAAREAAARIETQLGQLNARIAMLGHVVGADLSKEDEVQAILGRTHAHFRQHPHPPAATASAAERRLEREWEELRGLLALRCDLMAQSLSKIGLTGTQLVAAHVQASRDKEGLKPDSDGFHLLHHLLPEDKSSGV